MRRSCSSPRSWRLLVQTGCDRRRSLRNSSGAPPPPPPVNSLKTNVFAPTYRESGRAGGTEGGGGDIVASHRLMLRAGYMRPLSSGHYMMLPLAVRSLRKIEQIVDEEMQLLGAQKLEMPLLLPGDLWRRSGRWDAYGDELFRACDRRGADQLLAPTHEEAFTELVAAANLSYRALPLYLYQVGRKFRDEIRPRFGLLRAREFVMKDLYTFDRSLEEARRTYDAVGRAYERVFARLGLSKKLSRVDADNGTIGGVMSHEFHLEATVGEDVLWKCRSCGYAANEEKARAAGVQAFENELSRPKSAGGDSMDPSEGYMPSKERGEARMRTTRQHDPQALLDLEVREALLRLVHEALGEEGRLTEPYNMNGLRIHRSGDSEGENNKATSSSSFSLAVCRSDYALNLQTLEVDLARQRADPGLHLERLTAAETAEVLASRCEREGLSLVPEELFLDSSLMSGTSGELDLPFLRFLKPGDPCPSSSCNGTLSDTHGIEVGHVFLLGDRYSSKLNAHYASKQGGKPTTMEMGCYGIGISRLLAAAVQVFHDDRGITLPAPMAPFLVNVIPAGKKDPLPSAAREVYHSLVSSLACLERGVPPPVSTSPEVLLDDRDESMGVKMKDSELYGIPLNVVVGKHLQDGKVEVIERVSGERVLVAVENVGEHVRERLRELLHLDA